MKKVYSKLLLHVITLPKKNEIAGHFVDDIYACLQNALVGYRKMPNVKSLCKYCNDIGGKNLANDIRNQFDHLVNQDTFFYLDDENKSKRYFSNIDSSNKKNIRVLLYPGDRENISDLNMSETTHNMILQYTQSSEKFFATEKHQNPPSFYQKCNSVKTALCCLEALIVDSCLCHYLGITDVAVKHDQKQKISRDKIDFLIELVQGENFKYFTPQAQQLINYVLSKVTSSTPYISFFSIFSVAVQDVFKETKVEPYFEDFFKLFYLFQKWYFEKNGRLFHKDTFTQDSLRSIFNRNPYQGQISSVSFDAMIQEKCEKINKGLIAQIPLPPFGVEERWAVVVVAHMPATEKEERIFRSLFSGPIHQATVNIIPWNERSKYNLIINRLKVLPILICK